MMVVPHGCAGTPGSRFDGTWGSLCHNLAVVRLVERGTLKRKMCVDCALEFEALCEREELPAPMFELLPDAADLVT